MAVTIATFIQVFIICLLVCCLVSASKVVSVDLYDALPVHPFLVLCMNQLGTPSTFCSPTTSKPNRS